MDDRQLFDFETAYPPVLNQSMLEAELERRRLNRQTALLVVAGIFAELCILLSGVLLWREAAVMSAVCIGYAVCSSVGGAALAVVFHIRKGDLLWQ